MDVSGHFITRRVGATSARELLFEFAFLGTKRGADGEDRRCLIRDSDLCPLFPVTAVQDGNAANTRTPTTAADRAAVVQAIEDEIYDWGCQKHVEFVGKEVRHETYELRVYISPNLEDGQGEVIYKFMPFGEIHRLFWIGKSGLVYLEDTPAQGFGPERPAPKTVFMDDDEIWKDKRDWVKATFVIQYHPE